jgi:ATP-dependent DNA helicase RecG
MNIALPVNIKDLISGKLVESDRIEFKSGWNPNVVLHTMCAFANDTHNWGGGYIVIGIEAEDGQVIMPPIGVEAKLIDKIQGELLNLSHLISPNYFPIITSEIIRKKYVIIIWCPAGDYRPYRAPENLSKESKEKFYYVRKKARTIKAREADLKMLFELAARVPYDDRINGVSRIEDLDLGLIREFLKDVKSGLFEDSVNLPFKDLCRQLNIAKGPDEAIRPTNAGLLFFSKNPHKYHERARIELVIHHDYSGRNFYEKIYRGPIQHQVNDALRFIKSDIIAERVIKVKGKAKSTRYYNFPFEAVEEIIINAVYHKSYEINSPIEVQIHPDRMDVLSYPGPIPPIDNTMLNSRERLFAREYRNRRIGDLLKELNYTEGRGTGLPMVYHACEVNGSPKPVFETDKQHTYFLATLFSPTYDENNSLINFPTNSILTDYNVKVEEQDNVLDIANLTMLQKNILKSISKNPNVSRAAIAYKMGVAESTIQRHIIELKGKGYIFRHGSYKGYWEVLVK